MSENKFNYFDSVVSTEPIGKVPVGTKGTIVDIYHNNTAYEVEFFDNNNNTISVETCPPKSLKLV